MLRIYPISLSILLTCFALLSDAQNSTQLPPPGEPIEGYHDRSELNLWVEFTDDFGKSLRQGVTTQHLSVSPEFPLVLTSTEVAINSRLKAGLAQAFAIRWDLSNALSEQREKVQFALEYLVIGNSEETAWRSVPSGHNSAAYEDYFSELIFLDATARAIKLRLTVFEADAYQLPAIQVDVFHIPEQQPSSLIPGAQSGTFFLPQEDATRAACPCPQPTFETRADWCTVGDCSPPGALASTTPTHLIVHHSATSVPPGSTGSYRAAVTGIFLYHTGTLGWSDIGYNWLIDPSGGIYEGRGDGIRGAHMCGVNSGTVGFCMLGDFTSIVPYPAAREALVDWLAWESCDKSISALNTSFHAASGLTLDNISGHRDACATACPGNTFYPTFSSLRNDVQATIDACGVTSPPCLTPTGAMATVVTGGVELSWNNDPLYDNFALQGRKVPGPFRVKSASTNFKSFSLPAGTYEWQVWANCIDGSISDPTPLMSFTTLLPRAAAEPMQLTLYPNPAKDVLKLSIAQMSNAPYRVEIVDTDGKLLLVLDGQTSENCRIDLSQIPAGLKIIRVVTTDEVVQSKVVIER